MSVLNPLAAFRKTLYGERVDKAALAITGISTKPLFTVAGGRVIITSLVGEVTTVIQTQANNTKITFNPDGAGATSDLSAVLDISADAVGLLYGLTGTVTDTLLEGVQFLPSTAMTVPFVLSEGSIGVDTAASSTGAIAWTLTYVPLDDGASVVAV